MDDTRSITDTGGADRDFPDSAEPRPEAPPPIALDERRMHVRAYNYWVSLLDDRPYPSIDDLDPANIEDFGPYSVLLDFTSGPENAAIPFLGAALRAEGNLSDKIRTIADIPPRTVLSRLTDHYLEIIANGAPIGFEAEYINARGLATMYRGILMPFSSSTDEIDFIYGVINWKEIAEVEVADDIRDAVSAALAEPVAQLQSTPIWADGPNAQPDRAIAAEGLHDRLAAARESAELVAVADQRSHAALYQALGQAYDFAVAAEAQPDEYATILDDAGLSVQDRAPMTPVVKLVFGTSYDKTRLAEYAAVLAYGRRCALTPGSLPAFLDNQKGGLKAAVKAERALRRPLIASDRDVKAKAALAAAPARATLELQGIDSTYVTLVARREPDGRYAVIGVSEATGAELNRATRHLTL